MRDTESKREREKKMVSEMIALTAKRNITRRSHEKKTDRTKRSSARNAGNLRNMRVPAATDVRLWKRKLSAPIAGYTAINRR